MITSIERPTSAPVLPGAILRFSYPKCNEIARWTTFKRRTLLVKEVRDTSRNPILVQWFDDNPLRRRGRWLVTGIDLDIGLERSFYWESMRGQVRDTWLRLATYDPFVPSEPLDIIGGLFAPTKADRLFLARVIRKFNAWAATEKEILHNLRIFSARDFQ